MLEMFGLEGINTANVKLGAFRGGTFGLVSGAILGIVGYVLSPPIEYTKIIIWKNRFGKNTRFTHLDTAEVLKEDLLKLYKSRSKNEDAYNEAMRNIQSVIAIYHPVKAEGSPAGLMDSTRATNFAKRASRAMEEILQSVELESYDEIEKAMMSIHLNLEEFINFIGTKSGESLPDVKL